MRRRTSGLLSIAAAAFLACGTLSHGAENVTPGGSTVTSDGGNPQIVSDAAVPAATLFAAATGLCMDAAVWSVAAVWSDAGILLDAAVWSDTAVWSVETTDAAVWSQSAPATVDASNED
jgi:hypothetical protein